MQKKPEDDALFELLARQQNRLQQFDRTLWVVLPIVAFLLSVICANLNWQSTLGTFFVLAVALCGVGNLRWNLAATISIVSMYALADNFLSYGQQLNWPYLRLQLGTMLLFVGIVGVGRPYVDTWLIQKIQRSSS